MEGGVSEDVYIGGVGRGLEEAISCSEGIEGADVPVDICRGAGDLTSEVSPILALFAFEDLFLGGPLLNLTKSDSESSISSSLKSEMSTPSSFRRCM